MVDAAAPMPPAHGGQIDKLRRHADFLSKKASDSCQSSLHLDIGGVAVDAAYRELVVARGDRAVGVRNRVNAELAH